jgi:4-hydroxybenzoate polyprenyltransferase
MPSIKNWVIFTLGVIIMRSAGCVINDLIDRKVDGAVARTKDRPLITGVITPIQAWCLLALLCSMALILVLFLNLATFLWACLALTITLLYPLTKRFFPLPQAILGFGWYVSIFMAFAAQSHVNLIAVWFYIGAACWTIAYDTWYAMADKSDDIKIGIHSSAILFGQYDKLSIALFQLMTLGAWAYMGILAQLHAVYFCALVACALLFIYQYQQTSQNDANACFRAFLQNHWVGMILFIGIMSDYLLYK